MGQLGKVHVFPKLVFYSSVAFQRQSVKYMTYMFLRFAKETQLQTSERKNCCLLLEVWWGERLIMLVITTVSPKPDSPEMFVLTATATSHERHISEELRCNFCWLKQSSKKKVKYRVFSRKYHQLKQDVALSLQSCWLLKVQAGKKQATNSDVSSKPERVPSTLSWCYLRKVIFTYFVPLQKQPTLFFFLKQNYFISVSSPNALLFHNPSCFILYRSREIN